MGWTWLVVWLVAGCGFSAHSSTNDPHDASPPDVAPGDAPMSDAPMSDAPAGCSTTGLVCPNGQKVMMSCGTACWVGCTNGTPVTEPTARANCATWGGVLGSFGDSIEQDCVRAAIAPGSAMWIGLEQAPNQATPRDGWGWISGDALSYIDWASGQPNDGDGSELDHLEQCAYSTTQVTWQDTTCSDLFARYACKR